MPDLPSLLGQGVKSARKQEDVTMREMAKAYRDAYKVAESELSKLAASIGNAENKLLEAQKYNRLANLMTQISKEYTKLTGQAVSETQSLSSNNYFNGFKRVEWAVNQELKTGASIAFGVVPIDAVRASVFSEQSGRNFIITMKDNSRDRIIRIRNEITRMLATGQSWERTAEALAAQFEKGYNDAVRVVRTETARNYTQGTLAGFERAEDLGINMTHVWLATLDSDTRPEHAELDGTEADEDGLFWINGESAVGPGLFASPENSVNCRCSLVARIAGIKPQFRRENIDEKNVIPYQTWSTWAEAQGWSAQDGWPKAEEV